MADISNTSYWFELDASNSSPSPNGFQTGQMLPSQVEPVGQMLMGAITRFWDRNNTIVTTSGASGTYNYITANTSYPVSYKPGEIFRFIAHQKSAGNDVLQINSLGNVSLYKLVTTSTSTPQFSQIIAGDIGPGQTCEVAYNSSVTGFVINNPNTEAYGLFFGGSLPAVPASYFVVAGTYAPAVLQSPSGILYPNAVGGATMAGRGTNFDITLMNFGLSAAMTLVTNTKNWNMGGNLAIAGGLGIGIGSVTNVTSYHIDVSSAATPSVTAGTNATVVGNDVVGRITVGTTPTTTATISFLSAWANAPICFAQNETTNVTMRATTVATTSVVFTASSTLNASDKISYICLGYR